MTETTPEIMVFGKEEEMVTGVRDATPRSSCISMETTFDFF